MKKFGVGIIGCGAIFGVHAFPLHTIENVEVKAVCDIKPVAREAAARLFNCDAYEDYHDLLKRDDIDVIHVMTPHYLHAPMVIDAANAGKHVLSEKPMSITIEDAKAEIDAGRKNNVTIGVISQNRYNSASVAIKEAIDSGSLGKVVGQRILLAWFKPNEYYQNSDWHGTWDKEGGSLIIDQSIHILDLARWFVNDEIVSVQATIDNRNHPVIETEDTAEGLIKYRNGVQSVFYATNNYTYNSPVMVEIHCEKGTALMEFDRAVITYRDGKELNVLNNPNDVLNEAEYQAFFNQSSSQTAFQTLSKWGVIGAPVTMPITWKTPRPYWGITHIKQIKNFYESLTAGVQPDITAAEAFKTQEMICAIYESAKKHKPILLNQTKE
ncbi:MAG: Gfo/Idh/MocA family oxidoreductase [Anaerolineales bacterium]|nr:Gfo/Idh/MocA family oxidoreductase [Anaerolineales bacterium]